MVFGYRYVDFKLTEFEREFTTAEKCLVLPAGIIGIGRQARVPLCDLEDVVIVFLEVLVTGSGRHPGAVHDVEFPFDGKTGRSARRKRRG